MVSGMRTERYAALLRAVNLGPHNRVAMSDLRALVEGLGHHDVATYVQSGNIVFTADASDRAALVMAIEGAIAERLGLDVSVLLRNGRELRAVLAANPFARADLGRLYVTFLAAAPEPAGVAALQASPHEPDEVVAVGSEVYLHCPAGYGVSKLSNTVLEKKLARRATTRNWRTVTKLAELTE